MPRRARSLVGEIVASGREAGTAGAGTARRSISQFLTSLGYEVSEYPFQFNAAIYQAFPAAGSLLTAGSLVEVVLLARPVPGWSAATLLLVTLIAIALVSWRLVLGGTGTPRADANLVARRAGAQVRSWLVAHLDTKAQAQSMAGRLVAIWVTLSALVALTIACGFRLAGPLPREVADTVGVLGLLAGFLLARGRLSGESPGARDNGSGLLAVLTAAELATDPGIGIIITSGEEFGLAGARALAAGAGNLLSGSQVVNVDTIDDEGTLFIVRHGNGDALAARMVERLSGLAVVRSRRLPLGIMVDGVPLARAGSSAVTLGRLSWGTLRKLHTARDTAAGYRLETAEMLGERLATPI